VLITECKDEEKLALFRKMGVEVIVADSDAAEPEQIRREPSVSQ
jgi:hypothetical protein